MPKYLGVQGRRNANPLTWFIDQMERSSTPPPVKDHILRLYRRLPRSSINLVGFDYDQAFEAMKSLSVRLNLMRSQHELMNTATNDKHYFIITKAASIWLGADAKYKGIKTVKRIYPKKKKREAISSGEFIVPERVDVG